MFRRKVFFTLLLISSLIFSIQLISAQDKDNDNGKKTIKIAVFSNAPPVIFVDDEGNPAGIFPDLLNIIVNEIGYIPEFIKFETFNEAFRSTVSGKTDIMPALVRTPEREQLLNFNDEPFMVTWSQVYTSNNTIVESVFDLRGKRVGMQKGGQNGRNFDEMMSAFDIQYTAIEIETFDQITEQLINGKIDAGVYFSSFFNKELKIKATNLVFSPTNSMIAASKSFDPEIIKNIDKALSRAKLDEKGYYYKTLDNYRYIGRKEVLPRWALIVLVTIAALLITSVIIIMISRFIIKRVKKNLSESQLNYKTVADHNYNWEFWLDESDNFKYCSPSCERITGYTAGEFYANPDLINTIILNNDLKIWLNHVNKIRTEESPACSLEFRITTKSNELRWLEHSCIRIFIDGVYAGHRGSNRDITEQKQHEQKLLEEKLRAEESDRMKTAFLANISHELRTPLNGIMGMLELLSFSELDKQQQNFLNSARDSSYNLLLIIQDLLNLSRTAGDKMKLNPTEIDVKELIDSILPAIKLAAGEKGLKVKFKMTSEAVKWVVDRDLLMQSIAHILLNAVKFSEKGQIQVTAGITDKLSISIKDEGIGIDETNFDKIFIPFHQLENPFTRKRGGLGIGLTIVRQMCDKMNAEIIINSAPDKGSEFIMIIPNQSGL